VTQVQFTTKAPSQADFREELHEETIMAHVAVKDYLPLITAVKDSPQKYRWSS
jgi:hypothetical protein